MELDRIPAIREGAPVAGIEEGLHLQPLRWDHVMR